MKIKLMKFYATNGIDKQSVSYIKLSDCVLISGRGYFPNLENIFKGHSNYETDKDILSDYSKSDFVKIYPEDPLWADACARAAK